MLARFPEALKRKKSPLSDYSRSGVPTTAYHARLWFTKVCLICILLQHRGHFKQASERVSNRFCLLSIASGISFEYDEHARQGSFHKQGMETGRTPAHSRASAALPQRVALQLG